MLNPGDGIVLVLEPGNKMDSSALAVFSFRGFQIGYLTAERCGWIGAKIRRGQDVRAIFHAATQDGAIIRVHLDGGIPTAPAVELVTRPRAGLNLVEMRGTVLTVLVHAILQSISQAPRASCGSIGAAMMGARISVQRVGQDRYGRALTQVMPVAAARPVS